MQTSIASGFDNILEKFANQNNNNHTDTSDEAKEQKEKTDNVNPKDTLT